MKEFEARPTRNFVRSLNIAMEWYVPLLFVLTMSYDFMFATLLQYRNMRFDTHLERASSIAAIFGGVFIVGLFVFTIMKTKSLKRGKRYEADNRFDILHDHFRSDSRLTSMFILVILLQKALFAIITVYGGDDPATQISVLAGF